jgi:hypothetical protein
MEQPGPAFFFYFVSQPENKNIHDIRLGVKVVIPYMFQDHRFGKDLTGMPHEIFKKGILPWLEVYPFPAAAYFAF